MFIYLDENNNFLVLQGDIEAVETTRCNFNTSAPTISDDCMSYTSEHLQLVIELLFKSGNMLSFV